MDSTKSPSPQGLPPLLSTKLHPPQLNPNHLSRHLMVKRLQRVWEYPLTLVSAGSGFGKSSAVIEWLSTTDSPWGWYSLASEDNGLAQFFYYLITALQKIDLSIGTEIIPSLSSPVIPRGESIFTVLINHISQWDRDGLLILDDYHLIQNRSIHRALEFFLCHLPPKLHVILITRTQPPLPLGMLRSRGRLLEIGPEELRFSLDEVKKLFLREKNMSEEIAVAAEQHTDGWIVGLQLLLTSMTLGKKQIGLPLSTEASRSNIFQFLMEEVLIHLSESLLEYLMKLSVLNRLSDSLCQSLVIAEEGRPQPYSLEDLRRDNLFVLSLDSEGSWYRFHHLFKDFLYQQLVQSDADVKLLHTKAGKWYESFGDIEEAFHHYTEAGDVDNTARLVSKNLQISQIPGISQTFNNWLDGQKEELLRKHPELLILNVSYQLSNGKLDQVEKRLVLLEEICSRGLCDGEMEGRIALARSTLAMTSYDSDEIYKQAQSALNHLPVGKGDLRCSALWLQGMAHLFNARWTDAKNSFTQSLELSRDSANPLITILSILGLGQTQEETLQLTQARCNYEQVIQLSGEPGLPMVSEAHLGLARIHYLWNNLKEASSYIQDAIEKANQYDHMIDRSTLCEVFLAKLQRAKGNYNRAGTLLDELLQRAQQWGFLLRKRDIAQERILLHSQLGHWDDGEFLARKYDLVFEQAQVELAKGLAQSSLSRLNQLQNDSKESTGDLKYLERKLLMMLCHFSLNEKSSAFALLEETLSLSYEEKVVRPFLDRGKDMQFFLMEAQKNGIFPSYVGYILDQFPTSTGNMSEVCDQSGREEIQRLIEPLTKRELEVLQLVAQGHSNKEICEILCLAMDTVKGHNRHIFQKLHAENRVQAINTGRILRLIDE